MQKRISIIFLILIGATSLMGGVKDFSIKQYGIDQDFKGIFIYSIVQDNDGYLWIGSNEGLYRFDGKSMINLSEKDSVKRDFVTATKVGKDGHLYMGYFAGGINLFERGKYRNILPKDTVQSKINKICQGSDNEYWAISQNSGIVKIKGDKYQVWMEEVLREYISFDLIKRDDFLYVATNEGLLRLIIEKDGTLSNSGIEEGSFGKPITTLYEDPENSDLLWVGSEEGLFYIDFKNGRSLIPVEKLAGKRVTAVARDQLNTLWVGTAHSGLVELELAGREIVKTTNFDVAHGFTSNQINHLFVDRENEIWVGTFGNGLVQLNRSNFHYYELSKSTQIEGINDIYQVNRDFYYLATDKGLVKAYNEVGSDSLIFKIIPSTAIYDITRILVQKDIIWLGTSNKGLVRYDVENETFKSLELNPVDPGLSHMVRYLAEANDGSLWVSIAGNGVYNLDIEGNLIKHFNTRNGFYHNEIFAIFPDAGGNVWFGAHTVGLAILKNNNELDFLTKDEIFPGRNINSISQDDSGKIWIATAGEGLYSFDGEQFERYSESDGLVSDYCNAVEVDNSGQIWVGHRMGLSLIQPNYKLISKFDHPSELGETESVINSVEKDDLGNIWFGNPYGITKVILPHIQHRILERETHIQDIRLFFKKVDLLKFSNKEKSEDAMPDDIKFTHKNNHLTFDYIAINLKHPDAIYYQYMLDGYDKKWSPVTKGNQATFTNLDPGKYTFKVKESDHPELWGESYHSVTFEIDSPYWQKWWFYLLQITFILGVMLLTFILSKRIRNDFVIRLMVYISLFLLFEYIHTELEPYLDSLSGETPIFKVVVNLILALILLPIELKLEARLKRREKERLKDSVMSQ